MNLLTTAFLSSLIVLTSCSSYQKIDGTYFSKTQDALIVNEKNGALETPDHSILDNLRVKQNRRKIKLKSISSYKWFFLWRNVVDRYTFKILQAKDDEYLLYPSSKKAKEYFSSRTPILFKSKYSYKDKVIALQKIVLHSSKCFGCCDDYSMEIDNSGNVKMTNRGCGQPEHDSLVIGNYTGQISKEEMSKLNLAMQLSQLNKVFWPDRMCCDFPMRTLTIYFNGKCVSTHAMFPPIVSGPILGDLGSILKKTKFTKTNQQFVYYD